MNLLYLFAALAVLVWLQSVCLTRYGLSRLTYTRAFSRSTAFAGEQIEMIETLRNAKPLPLPWLKAESRLTPHLRFGGASAQEGALHEISGDAYHRSVFFVAPYSLLTRRQSVTLLKRGYYDAGSVALTVGDLFGMTTRTAQLHTGAAVCVYPRLLTQAELEAFPALRFQGEAQHKRWILPDPIWVAGIRPWRNGDARRDIHWPATARTNLLQVKARDYTADPRLLVILNVQRNENQWDNLMDYEQGPIERIISLAATLCVRALSQGVEAGVAANAPMGEASGPLYLAPARYAGRDEDILEALARLRIVRLKSFHTYLETLGPLTGMDILILSAYDSQLLQERMEMLRLRGNSVALWPITMEAAS